MDDLMPIILISCLKKIIGFILITYSYINIKDNNKKLSSKSLVSFFLGFVLSVIPESFDIEELKAFLVIPQIWIGIIVLLCYIILKLVLKLRNNYYAINANDDIYILKRTIDFKYNPSIAGFLFEHKLKLKDLSADILNLYAKKIVEIKKSENGKNEIHIGEKYEEYKEELKTSDKYIIEYIKNDNLEFNFLVWRDEVKKEYENLGFSKNPEHISDKMFFWIISSILVLSIFIFKVICKWDFISVLLTSLGIVILITFIIYIIYINIRVRYIRLTKDGKNAIKDCIKLKKFMEEYTLLKDRTVEEICIYESYIPYAVALGINKKYKGTIFEIFDEELANILDDIDIIDFYEEGKV